MSTLIKLFALALVAVLLAPILGANTDVGRVVSAALEDASAFCERRPEACHQTAELARETREAFLGLVAGLGEPAAGPLTDEDRALAPPREPEDGYDAFGANNPLERP